MILSNGTMCVNYVTLHYFTWSTTYATLSILELIPCEWTPWSLNLTKIFSSDAYLSLVLIHQSIGVVENWVVGAVLQGWESLLYF
jgi:hypothetical protein